MPEPTGFELLKQKIGLSLGLVDKNFIPGPKFKSQGYRLEELGPIPMEKCRSNGHLNSSSPYPNYYISAGLEETIKMAEEIQGCPVVGPWALH